MTTVYRALGRHGRDRHQHTDADCPLLAKAKSIAETEVESVDDERLCPYCAGDEEWNQSDDDDWSYQKALAREAGVDGEIVTDGGQDVVYVAAKSTGGSGVVVHTDPDCHQLSCARKIHERPADPYLGREVCSVCRGEVATANTDPNGPWEQLEAADPDDLVTDGGAPDPDAFQVPTTSELDAMRTALNLGQRELSRRADLEPSRFNHILHNDVDPHASTLRAFLDVLQDAEPLSDEEIERAGPKPTSSTTADHDPEDFELLSAQLHHSPPDAVGEDPRPPERERDSEIRTDGGTITACPECDSPSIKRRSPQKPDSPSHQTHQWTCLDCGAGFDAPAERAPEQSGGGLSGLAADLDAADPDAIPDGGGQLRSKAEMNTGRLSVAGVVGWPTRTESYVDLGDELDDDLPEPDRSEQERRARQAAHSLVAWASRAGLDPGLVLASVRAGLPRADGGEFDHYCEICERPFATIAALITHDCEERDAPLVTDGGTDLHRMTNVDTTEHYRQKARRLAREKALYVGVLLGGIATFIALFLWEVLQA